VKEHCVLFDSFQGHSIQFIDALLFDKKNTARKNGGKTVRKQMTRNFFSSNQKVDILNFVIWRVNRTQCDVGICGGGAVCGGGMALSSPMVTFASIKYHMTVKTWQRKRLVSSTIAKDDSRE
jgi:hypothetical protein